jgi:Uma2 family endonuclease
MSELIDVALPYVWTPEDLALLPEDGHRYEILDGALLMSPPPTSRHQLCAARIDRALARVAPAEFEVLQGVGVDLGDSMFVPDISVVLASVARADVTLFKPGEVLLAIEIVSPSSRRIGRTLKPAKYAEAGIPVFWRVEPGRGDVPPVIAVHELDGDGYETTMTIVAGETVRVERPFPVVLDPGRLVP